MTPGAIDRSVLLAPSMAVAREEAAFLAFLALHGLRPSPDSVALYLTALLDDQHLSGSSLRWKLRQLDRAATLRGEPPPSADRQLRLYLRGLHREASLGPTRNRTPLYVEDVHALVDQIETACLTQARDVALLLLANALPITSRGLAQLAWQDVKFARDGARLTFPDHPYARGPRGITHLRGPAMRPVVEALRELRRQAGPGEGPIFASVAGQHPQIETISSVLRMLPGRAARGRTLYGRVSLRNSRHSLSC
jgi:hypothetical protein